MCVYIKRLRIRPHKKCSGLQKLTTHTHVGRALLQLTEWRENKTPGDSKANIASMTLEQISQVPDNEGVRIAIALGRIQSGCGLLIELFKYGGEGLTKRMLHIPSYMARLKQVRRLEPECTLLCPYKWRPHSLCQLPRSNM